MNDKLLKSIGINIERHNIIRKLWKFLKVIL